jgi:hypothetical protein
MREKEGKWVEVRERMDLRGSVGDGILSRVALAPRCRAVIRMDNLFASGKPNLL